MEIVNSQIEKYIRTLYRDDDPVLKEMEAMGERLHFPIVGPLVGRVLQLLAEIQGAKTVYEMGSGFGYSTYWFARGLSNGGTVYHTEMSQEHSNQAKDYFEKGGQINKVKFLLGNALELIDQVKEKLDIVFIDIEKEDYPKAYEKAKAKLKAGGLLIADNVLWFGRVLNQTPDSSATAGIQKFNELLANDPDFEQVILPIRDGIAVCRKK